MVLFNAFFQPDVDIWHENHRRAFNLSHQGDYKQSLRYAGMLYGRVKADICSSRGIFTGEDVIKLLLTGASCVQMVSAVYRHGIERIGEVNREIAEWMQQKNMTISTSSEGNFQTACSIRTTPCSSTKRAQYIDLLMHSDTLLENLDGKCCLNRSRGARGVRRLIYGIVRKLIDGAVR